MPHRDLYGVTASLKELLRINLLRIEGLEVEVTDLPPEEAEKETGPGLNLHLYHAVETPYLRNEFPPDDSGPNPISRTPLPLTLYYAVTAHAIVLNKPDIKSQQRMMGLAMKSLHDFPVIDERLELMDPSLGTLVKILDKDMVGGHNRIEVMPRQLAPEESLPFWSAVQNHTVRLTAYYEVRSTLIFPDEATAKPGLVTAFALGVGSAGLPTLTGSSSTQTVTLPALSGGATLSSPVSPAIAALGATAAPAGNHVVLHGTDLGDGTDAKLVFTSPGFAQLVPPVDEAIVAPASNPAWKFLIYDDRIEFDVQSEVHIEAPAGFRTIEIRPGPYAVGLLRENQLYTEEGATTLSTAQSNRISISVGPRIKNLAIVAGPRIDVVLEPGVDCTEPENKLQLAIAGKIYVRVAAFTGDPTKDPGTFIVAAGKVTADPLFDPADGATRMVRFAVNGVDAQPVWLEPGP
jgi:uncharacterized protein DUF4255